MADDTTNDRLRPVAEDLAWLVPRRNQIQSLILEMLTRWTDIPAEHKVDAVAAAFSLWRAAFLLVGRERDLPDKKVEHAALELLEKVVRTNAISFADDLVTREWASNFYVEHAADRIGDLIRKPVYAFGGSPRASVREAWDYCYDKLKAFIEGTQP